MGEGFFVAGKNRTATPTHTFTLKNAYTTKPTAKSSSAVSKITIAAKANNLTVNSYIRLNSAASNGFDYEDAYKLLSWNSKACEPYFIVDSTMLSVNSIAVTPYECPMNINSNGANNVTLQFSTIPAGIHVYMIENGIETEVFNGSTYPVELTNGSNSDRFRIRIEGQENSLAGITGNEGISLWIADKTLNVNGQNLQQVDVYNALGQVVYHRDITGNLFSVLLNLPSGTYTAKAKSKTATETTKFVITK
jgi:hypothetical protein